MPFKAGEFNPRNPCKIEMGKIQSENLLFDVHMPAMACVFHLQHIVTVTGAGGIVSLLSDRFRHKKNMSAWDLAMGGITQGLDEISAQLQESEENKKNGEQ